MVFSIIASAGLGFAGAVVYGKYDPKFKSKLEENIPYISNIYKLFPDDSDSQKTQPVYVNFVLNLINEWCMYMMILLIE